MSFTLVYYLLTIIPIFHFMDSLTNKIVTPTDSFFHSFKEALLLNNSICIMIQINEARWC